VFAIRAVKGFRPIYVGKTKKNFKAESFTRHKIAHHYTPSLAQTGKGTPVMFLIAIDDRRGPPNQKIVGDLETFLIPNEATKNPSPSNIQNRQEVRWGDTGCYTRRQRQSNKGFQAF
jgi:hypothetical protein